MSILGLRGGVMGENPSGTRPKFIGSSAGRQMLKRKEKPPKGVIIPTSPILMPHLLYPIGSRLFGSGIHRGKPRFFIQRCLSYISLLLRVG